MSDDAVIRLGYDNAKVRQGAEETAGLMTKLKGKVSAGFSKMGPAMIFGGIAAGAVAAGAGIARAVSKYGELADQAARIGTTVETMQKLAAMGAPSGADPEQLVDSLSKLRRAMGDPENEKAARAMDALGLSAERLAQLSPEDQLIELARGFQAAQATGRGFNQIYDLLGKSASNLIPTLRTSLDQLKQLRDRPVLSEANAAILDDVGDKLSVIGQRAEIIGAKAASWALSYFRVNEVLDFMDEKMGGLVGKQSALAKQPVAPQAIEAPKEKQEDKAARARQREQAANRESLAAELAAMQARASGHEKLAKKIEEEQAMKKRGAEIATQLGITEQGGMQIAKREKELADMAAKRASGKILGARSREGGGLDDRGFSGLDAFQRLQVGGRGERRNAAFGDGEPLDQILRSRRGSPDRAGDRMTKPSSSRTHGGGGENSGGSPEAALLKENNLLLGVIAKNLVFVS